MSQVLAVVEDAALQQAIEAVAARHGMTVLVPRRDLDVTEMLLQEETRFVVLDVDHPNLDAVATVRLVRGTRWDCTLSCIGDEPGHIDGVSVERRDTFIDRLPEVLASA